MLLAFLKVMSLLKRQKTFLDYVNYKINDITNPEIRFLIAINLSFVDQIELRVVCVRDKISN